MNRVDKPINLLWTGGWDSSFRLLQLVLVFKKQVQPYYIIDHRRNSLTQEVRAMSTIKRQLDIRYPEARSKILPTIFKEINEIEKDRDITRSYNKLKQFGNLLAQYEWLARFAKEQNINDLEISYEKEISDPENTTRVLTSPYIIKRSTSAGTIYRLINSNPDEDLLNLYGRFNFPVYFTTKMQMQEIANEYGFIKILENSWFCLMPTKSKKPCGKCHPCQTVYLEGLKRRLPFAARVRYHTWPTFRKIAHLLTIKRQS